MWSRLQFLLVWLMLAGWLLFPGEVLAAPEISNVSDPGSVKKYEKFEISFQVNNSVAGNPQLPYDSNPPNGIDPANYPKHDGISVDAVFISPSGKQFQQPGFIYQPYQTNQDGSWYYPEEELIWKVRFAPDIPGTWEYKLKVRDKSGNVESGVRSFQVQDSNNKGFVKVSARDPRYFEFDDGSYFPAIGRHARTTYDQPGSGDTVDYAQFGENKVTLIRDWMSGFYGSAWQHWRDGRNTYDYYLPRTGLEGFVDPNSGKEHLVMVLAEGGQTAGGWYYNCRRQDLSAPHQLSDIKPNTDYQVSATYIAEGITGPRQSGASNYGFVVKIGGWNDNCGEPDGLDKATYYGGNSASWAKVEGIWNSGSNNEARLHLALENAASGKVWIRDISMKEVVDSRLGSELVSEHSAEYDTYYPERMAYEMDRAIEAVEAAGIYLKLVVMDKSDMVWWKMQDDGTLVTEGESDDQLGFYGNWRFNDRKRWLWEAYFRYLQARWGYSTNIHSWELTNEGEPGNGNHWASTDEMGKAFKCRVFGQEIGRGDGELCTYDHPNEHMVTTSFYHSYPDADFWVNSKFPNVDYADVHAYISTGWQSNSVHESDSALFHWDYADQVRQSTDYYADQAGIATKPIIRGETGIDTTSQQEEQARLLQDNTGVWLHNFTWASLSPSAMIEMYWWGETIDSEPGPDGATSNGLMEVYEYFYNFISNIPLNNGNYADAEAVVTDPNLRMTGQKDEVNNRAHVWVQNKSHTWKKVVNGNAGSGLTGTVTLTGFNPNTTLPIEMHEFTTQGMPNITFSSEETTSNGSLIVQLPTNNSITDVGIKIGSYTQIALSPTPNSNQPGDTNNDGVVDILDYSILITEFGTEGIVLRADFNEDGRVDILDFSLLVSEFGR